MSERSSLVLGPLQRYVDETSATVWVETADAAVVRVVAGECSGETATFCVHGHHYALVLVEGLDPGAATPYQVFIDDVAVWPVPDGYPASRLRTLDHTSPPRIAFGSCRTSVSHDAKGNDTHGVDALRAYALALAGETPVPEQLADDEDPWPDLLLFLGDQVYADETTAEMREYLESRRDLDQPPWTELKDYEEYAHLYRLAWSDPANRWLLANIPSAMIFDDHDIRDDWNTSLTWKEEMEATEWWHSRILGGLASYWVYQHLGNMGPEDRAADPIWQRIVDPDRDPATDLGPELDELADRADQEPTSYRWSYYRQYGDWVRLVVIDSRAARVLDPDRRAILDEDEMAWLDDKMRGDVDHLLIGTSLPFLLAPGLHYVEAFSESLAEGAWGRRPAAVGEKIRQVVDLEHWAAFQKSFQQVAAMAMAVARGQRGRTPETVTFLSGDVHHSYVSEARPTRRETRRAGPLHGRIIQAVCSPIRNPLARRWRFATAFASYGVASPIGRVVAHSAKVPDAPLQWRLRKGPWFDNNLATLEVTDQGLRMWWARGTVPDGHHDRPVLETVADITVRRHTDD